MSPLRLELRRMSALALPVAATQLSSMMLGLVDTLMVGRVSVEALGAAAIANVWIYALLMFANGVLFGLDPIIAQAHGARDGQRIAEAFQRGVVLSLLMSIPVCYGFVHTETVLLLAGQEPTLAALAGDYALFRMPGVPFFLTYSVLRQYLQGRAIVRPALFVILVANLVNVLLNWVLIFGHLGFPALGLVGAGLATSLTRVISLLGLLAFIRGFRLHRGAWQPWSRSAFDPRGLREILGYGVPIAFQTSFEMWAFSGSTLLAGLLGPTELAAHTIAMSMASIAFMLPLGIAQAAATRVGNLLGARRGEDAQRAAWVGLALGAGVMTFSATAFVLARDWLPGLYTPDALVIATCASILPIAGAFQIFDGTQVVACGILRGMGKVKPAMLFNFIGYWVLGLPLGAWLALKGGYGLPGLWWALCLGLAVVSTLLVFQVRHRGPATQAPLELAA